MTSIYPSQPAHNHHKPHPPQNSSQVDTNPKLYCVSIPRQVTFMETIIEEVDEGVDNPFRPGDRLSKEAEIIVQLIKAGKPISPQSPTEEDIRALEEWKKQQEMLLHPELDESKYIADGQMSPNGLSLTINGNNNTTRKVDSPKGNGNNNNYYKNNVKSRKGSSLSKRKAYSPSSSPSTPSSPQNIGHHQTSFDSQADSAFEKKKKVCCVIQ